MNLKEKIEINLQSLKTTGRFIERLKRNAHSVQEKANYVENLLIYEKLKRDTLVLFETLFKEEQSITYLEYYRVYRAIKKDLSNV